MDGLEDGELPVPFSDERLYWTPAKKHLMVPFGQKYRLGFECFVYKGFGLLICLNKGVSLAY